MKNGIDATSVEGAANLPYDIPNLDVELHTPKVGRARCSGGARSAPRTRRFRRRRSSTNWPTRPEGSARVAARAAGASIRVISACSSLAAEKAGWSTPLPAGRARGVAVHESFASFVAQVAEVSRRPGRPAARRTRRLRRRLRHRDQSRRGPRADGRRHRLRPRGRAAERDHARRGTRRADQLPRLPAAAHRRDAARSRCTSCRRRSRRPAWANRDCRRSRRRWRTRCSS